MASLYAKLIESLVRWLVMPLVSSLIVNVVKYFQEKRDKAQRDEKIDKAVEDFNNAKTNEEKQAAFLNLVRSRSS